jgi:hypothetical protein
MVTRPYTIHHLHSSSFSALHSVNFGEGLCRKLPPILQRLFVWWRIRRLIVLEDMASGDDADLRKIGRERD